MANSPRVVRESWLEWLEVLRGMPVTRLGLMESYRETYYAAFQRCFDTVNAISDRAGEEDAPEQKCLDLLSALYGELQEMVDEGSIFAKVEERRIEEMNEVELRKMCRHVGHTIEDALICWGIKEPMFTLLIWNDPKIGQYLSNCERSSMIEALKETVARLEAKEDVER